MQIKINNLSFWGCGNLEKLVIGKNTTSMGYTLFLNCNNLTEVNYLGTIEEWNNISKDTRWNVNSKITTIKCADGDITL